MNAKMKRRMIAVTGIIVIVLVVVLAIVGGNTAARTVSIAQALEPGNVDKKVKVEGNVVENSFTIEGNMLTFSIYDPSADPASYKELVVRYDGGVSATFGNDVVAICTGKMSADAVLVCSELVTKCPSKYESISDALSIEKLLGYGSEVVGKPVKIYGTIKEGTLAGVDKAERFTLVDPETGHELAIHFDGALSDKTGEGASVVLTGSIGSDRTFTATNVALEA